MRKFFILLWIAIAAFLIFLWVYLPALSRYRDLKIEQEGMEKEIRGLDHKIRALKEEKRLLQNDTEYLEKVIRKELGLVKPGEIVYKFVSGDAPGSEDAAPRIAPADGIKS